MTTTIISIALFLVLLIVDVLLYTKNRDKIKQAEIDRISDAIQMFNLQWAQAMQNDNNNEKNLAYHAWIQWLRRQEPEPLNSILNDFTLIVPGGYYHEVYARALQQMKEAKRKVKY